jgi:cell division protein FtsB
MKSTRKRPDLLTIVVRIVVVCVLVFMSINLIQYYHLSSQLKSLERDQRIFKEHIEELQDKIQYAETDFFIEKMAREESDLAKPGDFVIKFTSK